MAKQSREIIHLHKWELSSLSSAITSKTIIIVFGLREYQHIKHWITLNSLFELIGKIVQQTITQM